MWSSIMILNRYILREFFRFASGTLILCIFFFILFDFIQKAAGYLGKYSPSARQLTSYYLMQIPFEIYQAVPIGALLASVVVMVVLARTGETTAMRAAGMSPMRIIAPIAMGGLLLSITSFILGEFVIPYTSRRAHYIKQVAIEGEDAGLSEGAYWVRTPSRTYNFKAYNPAQQSLEQLRVLTLSRDDFAPLNVLQAHSAFYLANSDTWVLTRVNTFDFDRFKKMTRAAQYPYLVMKLPVEPQNLKFDRRMPFELSLSEISTIVESGQQANADILSYRIAWHMKFAYPLAAFLISFLGLRFGYRTERTGETVRGLFVALGLALSYWFILSISKAMCSSGTLHPFFAGWLANLWVSIVVVWEFTRLYRGQK